MVPLFDQLRVEQGCDAILSREAFGNPLRLDRLEDARDLGPGFDSARDDCATFEREGGGGPSIERIHIAAREQQRVERFGPAQPISQRARIAFRSARGRGQALPLLDRETEARRHLLGDGGVGREQGRKSADWVRLNLLPLALCLGIM